MGIKVAINGYGRIGRQILRAIYDYKLEKQLDIVAINASGRANQMQMVAIRPLLVRSVICSVIRKNSAA